jgi:hydroxymethylbilane synthase
VSIAQPNISSRVVLGTRGSALALAQSRHVATQLQAAHPALQIEERIIRTTGDMRRAASLPAIGGKGVFTLEIEAALLNGEIDFAVHSLKDLPPDMPAGLCLAAVPERAAPADVLIHNSKLKAQNSKLKIGTSSLRRRAMILSIHPDWHVQGIRGNVGTRLEKMQRENFDAIILAHAGLQRLQLEPELQEQIEELDSQTFIPAPGQGALGIQSRSDDERILALLATLEHDATRAEIIAERAIVRALNAGCSTPLGALAVATPGVLSLRACVLSPDGQTRIDVQGKGLPERAAELGQSVAQKLLEQGAQELLA